MNDKKSSAREETLLKRALPDCAFTRQLQWLEEIDSTNDEIKRLVSGGACAPLTVIANGQTKGRGRLGRSFLSAGGKGLYLSAYFSPSCPTQQLSMVTAWTAVAVRRAVEKLCGIGAEIKWPNDLVLDGQKLCGILTELLTDKRGEVKGVIVGVGINVTQTAEDFGDELGKTATSLAQHMDAPPTLTALAGAVLAELDKMTAEFPKERSAWLDEYRKHCLTIGRAVTVGSGTDTRQGVAEGVDENFALRVCFEGDVRENIAFGEVSVRGIYGYAF